MKNNLHSRLSMMLGQASVEYVIVCAALTFALGISMVDGTSPLLALLDAFQTSYRKIAYALSIPT